MSSLNHTCPTCKKAFHHCGSCGYDGPWSGYYCSHECWEVAQEEKKPKIIKFYRSLTPNQQEFFMKYLDDTDEYTMMLHQKWIGQLEREKCEELDN